jgi:hypothetical protein
MAPMGWQVLAGLMVKALRSVISLGVCRNNIDQSSMGALDFFEEFRNKNQNAVEMKTDCLPLASYF